MTYNGATELAGDSAEDFVNPDKADVSAEQMSENEEAFQKLSPEVFPL